MAILLTQTNDWHKLKDTNLTGASFTALRATVTEPTGDGVISWGAQGSDGTSAIELKFFGTDTNNQTLLARVWAWNRVFLKSGAVAGWDVALLAQFSMILGNIAGATGCGILSTDFEVDTITVTYGSDNVALVNMSPTGDLRGAHVIIDARGAEKIQVDFDRNSSAASCNALWRKV